MDIQLLREMVEAKQWGALREALNRMDRYELVNLLKELKDPELVLAFRLLHKDRAIEVFESLDVDDQAALVGMMGAPETVTYIEALDPDDRARLFEELPAKVTKRLINNLSPESRESVNLILGYPEDSAGRYMTSRYIAVRDTSTVREILMNLHNSPLRPDEMYIIYVIDRQRVYRGYIGLGSLIKANPDEKAGDLAQDEDLFVFTTDSRTRAADIIMERDLPALAVVDREKRLVGSVTFDDVLDVVEEEVTEDFQKMAPIIGMREKIKDASVSLLYQKRIPWLLLLVLINLFSGAGIAYFEETIQAKIALVMFLPLLIDSAGNVGSQSSTLIIRSLATDDVRLKDWFELMVKECGVAFALGITLAIAVGTLGIVRGGLDLAVVVGLSMLLVVLAGAIIGLSLPFLMTRFGMDPATGSAPLVTSIADIMGVFIYFSIATALLSPG